MEQELVNIIMFKMSDTLDNLQMMKLKKILEDLSNDEEIEDDSNQLLIRFISTKRLEGRSERTLNYYEKTIMAMIDEVNKNVRAITTDDLRHYLTLYQKTHNVSKTSVDNIRRNLSSFFNWLEEENYILKSPMKRIHKIKTDKIIKETLSDESLECLRDNCDNLRDLAIIDLLASTGMRVGELVKLNINDIDFENRECVVFVKGNKERPVYFDARTKIHLRNYLNSRTDKNQALFVSLDKPYNRLKISGVEIRLRSLGRKLGINKVHLHKFRRTVATKANDKGKPIEQVQSLLAHSQIDTTMHYAMVNQNNVKESHRKYVA